MKDQLDDIACSASDSHGHRLLLGRLLLLFLSLGATVHALEERRPWRVPARKAQVANPLERTPLALERGQRIYEQECATCHGASGRGDGPGAREIVSGVPPFSGLPAQPDGSLFYKISSGRDPMPGYRQSLSEEELWQTVHYLRKIAPTPTTAPANAASMEELAVIDATLVDYAEITRALASGDAPAAGVASKRLALQLKSGLSGTAGEDSPWSRGGRSVIDRAEGLSATSREVSSGNASGDPLAKLRSHFALLTQELLQWVDGFGHGQSEPLLLLQTTARRKPALWIAFGGDSGKPAPNPYGPKASPPCCIRRLSGPADEAEGGEGIGR